MEKKNGERKYLEKKIVGEGKYLVSDEKHKRRRKIFFEKDVWARYAVHKQKTRIETEKAYLIHKSTLSTKS